ncbi:MAG: DNA-directed RNA polymerase [Candidatus Micrarchaeia archaeon]|jgi:DNA-directed RNA polymerase subunit E'
MFKLLGLAESVRIPPELFGIKMADASLKILREQYERTVDKQLGVIVSLSNAKVKSSGKIFPGDGAAYFDVEFDALVYVPEINEIVEGEVTEIVEFGAFVRLGPIDGLVHVSQVANDFLTYDKKQQILVGRKTKKALKKADIVRAKIATVSLKDSILNSKIALTMRPLGLGKAGEKSDAPERASKGAKGEKAAKGAKAGKAEKEGAAE